MALYSNRVFIINSDYERLEEKILNNVCKGELPKQSVLSGRLPFSNNFKTKLKFKRAIAIFKQLPRKSLQN